MILKIETGRKNKIQQQEQSGLSGLLTYLCIYFLFMNSFNNCTKKPIKKKKNPTIKWSRYLVTNEQVDLTRDLANRENRRK